MEKLYPFSNHLKSIHIFPSKFNKYTTIVYRNIKKKNLKFILKNGLITETSVTGFINSTEKPEPYVINSDEYRLIIQDDSFISTGLRPYMISKKLDANIIGYFSFNLSKNKSFTSYKSYP
jgi:hypothetical protein